MHLEIITPDKKVSDALSMMSEFKIGGIPVVNKDNTLVGIVTNRDLRFEKSMNKRIEEVMTKDNLVTTRQSINLEDAAEILQQHKIEKLPVVKISPEFTLESVYNMTDDYSFGFAVDENLAEELDLINTPGIKFYPSRLCLTTLIKSEGANHICPRSLQDALNYMDKHNMKMADNAWGITIGNYTKNGIHQKYHLIYIPIEYRDHQ